MYTVLARRETSKTKQTSTFSLKFRKEATETLILAYQTDVSVSFTHAGNFIWDGGFQIVACGKDDVILPL
jgi:hypothetical protein